MVEIFDNYNRPKSLMEPGGGKNIVETAGYVPVKIQVEQMIFAGQRLNAYRQEQYDYPEGEKIPDEIITDPTRSPQFDMADGTQIGTGLRKRLKEDIEKNNKLKKEEKEKEEKEEKNGTL